MKTDGSEISVSGKYKLEKELTLKLSVAATDGKEVAAMPEYINLAKITEEKLLKIAQAIENSGLYDPYPDYGWGEE